MQLGTAVFAVTAFIGVTLHNGVPDRLVGALLTDASIPASSRSTRDFAVDKTSIAAIAEHGDAETRRTGAKMTPTAPPSTSGSGAARRPTAPRPLLAPRPGEPLERAFARATRLSDPVVHEVEKGGSLWRTARKVVTDEVLLDKLVDNLAASGMAVGSVRAGETLAAEEIAPGIRRIRVGAGDTVYLSDVGGGHVVTAACRLVGFVVDASFTADATAAGVPKDVIDALLATSARRSLGLAQVSGGTDHDVVYCVERAFGAERGEGRALALSRGGKVIWSNAVPPPPPLTVPSVRLESSRVLASG